MNKLLIRISLCILMVGVVSCSMSSQPQNVSICSTVATLQFPTDKSVLNGYKFQFDGLNFICTNETDKITLKEFNEHNKEGKWFYFPASKMIFDIKGERDTFFRQNNHLMLASTMVAVLRQLKENDKKIYEIKRSGNLSLKGIIDIKRVDGKEICFGSEDFHLNYNYPK